MLRTPLGRPASAIGQRALVNADDCPAYAKARLDFFGEPGPASSAVFVSGLVNPEFLVEVEAIAAVGV